MQNECITIFLIIIPFVTLFILRGLDTKEYNHLDNQLKKQYKRLKKNYRKHEAKTIEDAKLALSHCTEDISRSGIEGTRAGWYLGPREDHDLEMALAYYTNKNTPEKLIDYMAQTLIMTRLLHDDSTKTTVNNVYAKMGKNQNVNFYDEFKTYKAHDSRISEIVYNYYEIDDHLNRKLISTTGKYRLVDTVDHQCYPLLEKFIQYINETSSTEKSNLAYTIEKHMTENPVVN